MAKEKFRSVKFKPDSIAKIDLAISQVNVARSTFGAAQNRFDAVIAPFSLALPHALN